MDSFGPAELACIPLHESLGLCGDLRVLVRPRVGLADLGITSLDQQPRLLRTFRPLKSNRTTIGRSGNRSRRRAWHIDQRATKDRPLPRHRDRSDDYWGSTDGTWGRNRAVRIRIFTERSRNRSLCSQGRSEFSTATSGSTPSPATTCRRRRVRYTGFAQVDSSPHTTWPEPGRGHDMTRREVHLHLRFGFCR